MTAPASAPDSSPQDAAASEAAVRATLARAQARLLLLGRLQASGPGALAAAILVQLALLPGSPRLPCALLATLATGWALVQAARLQAPTEAAVGAYLDARVGSGAVLAAAAEALDGAHPRFREPLVHEAAQRLREVGPRAYVPWRLSPACALALAATALSPLSLSSAPPPPGPRLGSRSLLDPSLLGAGGAGAPGSLAEPDPAPEGARYGAGAGDSEDRDPTPLELPFDVAAALAKVLGPPPGGGQGGSGAAQSEEPGSDPILASAAEGGLEQAVREVEELQSAAQGGDRVARLRLDRLRQALAKASGGGGGVGGVQSPLALPGAALPLESSSSTAGVAELPPSLAGALERYFGG